ncbi:MAG: hypothetical protein IH588_09815 [Anaerolineales bacterium]|nr:hypothetical protein [Anaerolineales bacterium]
MLKELDNEDISLPDALPVIQQAKAMIKEVETFLPDSRNGSFRQRLVAHLELMEKATKKGSLELEFQRKAEELLKFYEDKFGVNDLVDKPEESQFVE